MNKVKILGIFLNLIVYVIMILPIIAISFKKNIYNSKKHFSFAIILSFIIEIFISIIIYIFPKQVFSFLSNTSGIINYAIYSSKIFFITSSLYGIKILIPAFLFSKKMQKKATILVLAKIVTLIIFIFFGYSIFNTKGILYAFPASDFLFYILYSFIFLEVVRNNI